MMGYQIARGSEPRGGRGVALRQDHEGYMVQRVWGSACRERCRIW